ncbi:MAG: methyltransferase domain-containing protein [Planctomycetes bacterium]|nr:methyltransferase domain-containing protein [Planctomycetota bacterium]MCB9909851.1 methyltransferase domain-containing protein [Planctomycetota bacterium]MCB9913400.1 methyltransferase domain-containing protein [Planctomycetota bacterium]HPF12972.1 methyltransferase domain-containing protein [Planctomycetota bacterium]HRV80349.1 methyltransferase domain-containing protein [Planctomycetota bacterium]
MTGERSLPGTVLDLGCGPNKVAGAWGVDHHPYAGVDQIADLDQTPWELPTGHFEVVHAHHVIEHVASIPDWMREIRRVCRPGALVHITTPHFTSIDSWTDPTHRWHLACGWHETFTGGESYLGEQVRGFEHVSTELGFRRSFFNWLPKAMIRIKGLPWYEKKFAFRYPARNIRTLLRAIH